MEPATLLEKVFYVVMMVVAMLASLSILAIIIDVIIDIIGEVLPHGDYPSFFKILWDELLLRWL